MLSMTLFFRMIFLFLLMFFLFLDTWKALHFTEVQISVWIKFSHIQHQDIKTTCEWEEGKMWVTKRCKQYCNYLLCNLLYAAVCCWSRLLRPPEDEKNTSHSLLEQPGYKCLLHTLLCLILCQTMGSILFLHLPSCALCTISRPWGCVNDQQKSSEV